MKLVVNGAEVEVDDRHAKTPLLWVLRDVLGLHGTKFGCGAGFCAACTVLIDGANMKSCQTATERAVGKAVTTVEGASGPMVDAVREAWHCGNVVQCGYCQPGQTLAAVSLLESNPAPDDEAIDSWLSGNLCRCGTYPRIRAAIHEAAGTLAAGRDPGPLVAPPDPDVQGLTPDEMADPVHPYIRIREDGTIVAYSSQIEMGQGVHTGLATIVAEELDADFDSILVVNASNGGGPPKDVYGTPDAGGVIQLTGGSNSTKGFWVRYRVVAAQARARLAAAAAELWDVPADEVEFERGVARHASGKEATFAQLAARAEQLPVPDGVQPKDLSEYKLIGGERRLHVDSVPKILGTTRFTIDVSVPGMLTAVVLHPPRFDAAVASVDGEAALAEPGVTAVVAIEEGVAVVAETVADAQRGLGALTVEWDDSGAERRSSEELLVEHVRLLESGEQAVVARDDGDAERVLEAAPTVVDVMYAVPYLAHATMEPNNAACRMREEGVLEVWASTESPEYTRMSARRQPGSTRSRSRFTSPSPGDRSGCTQPPSATPRPRPYRSPGPSTGSIRSRSSR
jgi:isoquinoline 1-oxidoreductase beta subunit